MSNAPYTVSVVVDRDCGPCIRELLETGPVWVIDSAINRRTAQEIWAEFPNRDHLDGVTVFTAEGDQPPTQILIDQLDTIDMHHGVYSADPAYTVVRVIGTGLNPEIRAVLARFGFDSFKAMESGFEAVRPLPRRSGT